MAIQIRRGSNSDWESNNSKVTYGEPAFTYDTGRFFVGKSTVGTWAEFMNIETLATPYDTATTYNVGDYCVYRGKLYQCTASTTGDWDATKWNLSTVGDKIAEVESELDALGNVSNLSYTVVSTF